MTNKIIVITGPSGFRKSYLLYKAVKSFPDRFLIVPSYTDKPKSLTEKEGENFFYVSEDEFTQMIKDEKFIEWQRLLSNGFRYGKHKEVFEQKQLNSNPDQVLLTIVNIINLPVFKRYYPSCKSIFVDAKDTKSLIDYLRDSPDVTDEEEFEKRMKFATEERRRRHLADITIHSQDDDEKTFDVLIEQVNNLF